MLHWHSEFPSAAQNNDARKSSSNSLEESWIQKIFIRADKGTLREHPEITTTWPMQLRAAQGNSCSKQAIEVDVPRKCENIFRLVYLSVLEHRTVLKISLLAWLRNMRIPGHIKDPYCFPDWRTLFPLMLHHTWKVKYSITNR